MLKSLLLSTILILSIISSKAFGKILRVGYPGEALKGVDYANFRDAHDAASAGDIIQIYQHYGNTSGGDVTKKLTIIGFGYMLDKNPGLQAINISDDNSTSFSFKPGSAGSSIQGMNLNSFIIYTNNITISRCRIGGGTIYNYEIPLSNIIIKSCYFNGGLQISHSGTIKISNLYIVNNVFRSSVLLANASGSFANNVAFTAVDIHSFLIKNNIFDNGARPKVNSNIFENNLFWNENSQNDNSEIIGTGNKFKVDMSTVFSNWNNGNIQVDNQLTLKAGSPAKGAGKRNDGKVTDAGIFGGEDGDIYRLSGIPAVPAIYKLTAPSKSATNNPYTISVGVRSNN